MKRISATQASRSFSRMIDQADRAGESFIIERDGRAVAELRPVPRRSTVADLMAFLRDVPLPDPDFRGDMLQIIELSARDVPRDRRDEDER